MNDLIESFEEYYEVRLPTKREVCHRCDGGGRHVNPAIDGNGITGDEMAELGEDFREDYLTGVYDVTCEECGGRNVVDVVDEDRCDPEMLIEFINHVNEEYSYRAMVAAERRMGA
jgi:predicted methyltransferase